MTIPHDGRNLVLHLRHKTDLLVPTAYVENFGANYSEIERIRSDCYYQGYVESDDVTKYTTVALSTCHGLVSRVMCSKPRI